MSKGRLDLLNESRLKRKKRARIRAIIQAILFFLLFGMVVVLVRSPLLTINNIEVNGLTSEGSQKITEEVKKSLAGNLYLIVPEKSVFLVSSDKVTQNLRAKFPSLGSVAVSRPGLNKLLVEVNEKKTKALWCVGGTSTREDGAATSSGSALLPAAKGNCYFVDKDGVAYATAPEFSDNLYLKIESNLSGDLKGKSLLSPLGMNNFLSFEENLTELFKNYPSGSESTSTWKVGTLVYKNYGDFSISLSRAEGENVNVLFNIKEDPQELAANLTSVLVSKDFKKELKNSSTSLEYLDLRFGKKVFYKFRTQ